MGTETVLVLRRCHKPNDVYNCLCHECVYQSLRRMGGPWKLIKQTRKEYFAAIRAIEVKSGD